MRKKKLIQWGWGEPSSRFLRKHIARMEKSPFDGIVFHATTDRFRLFGRKIWNRRRDGDFSWEIWGDRKFTANNIRQTIKDLQNTSFKRFTDRFLRVNVTPGNVDWFDDQAWSTVVANFAIASQIVLNGKCHGFMFDTEAYEYPLFDFRHQKWAQQKSIEDYRAIVRQRGREWIREVNKYSPNIMILLTFGYFVARGNPGDDGATSKYGLLADFLDGVIEASSETTSIVDGWEAAYSYKEKVQFALAREITKKTALKWTAVPEIYQARVTAGFGIWMDYQWSKNGWNTEDFTSNYFTPKELKQAVMSALSVSDEYVWLYSEQPNWWSKQNLPPAYVAAISESADP